MVNNEELTAPDKSAEKIEAEKKLPIPNGVESLYVQKTRKFEKSKERLDKLRRREIVKADVKKEREATEETLKIEKKGFMLSPGKTPKDDNYVESQDKKDEKKVEMELKVAEKEVLDDLSERHEAEMEEALENLDFSKLDEETRKKIHTMAAIEYVSIDMATEQDKKEALKDVKGPNGEPIDTTKPLSEEQKQIVQMYQSKRYIDAIKNVTQDMKGNTEAIKIELKKMEKDIPGISEFVRKNGEMVDQEKFFTHPETQKELKKLIREKGLALSGIDPNSEFAKPIVEIMKRDVNEYLGIKKSSEEGVNIDTFKGLKDILGVGYIDLFTPKFPLGDDHILRVVRDKSIELFQDAMAQYETPDLANAEEVKKHQETTEKELADATGLPPEAVQQFVQSNSGGGFNNLSPFVRLLADLFAPLGALMPGEVGDYWRDHLNNSGTSGESYAEENRYGEGVRNPIEGNGIANAEPGSIHAAASKYVGISESANPDKIREFHQSGGSAVKGAGPGTAWCMSFVQHVLRKDMSFGDQIGSPTAWARDGHKMGKHTDNPKPGDIVLIKSSAAKSGRHIGFVDSINSDGSVNVLGGNQGNAVSVKKYSKSSVAEFRTLKEEPKTQNFVERSSENGIKGKITTYQEKGDSSPDRYSRNRIGAFYNSFGPLEYGDLAVSRDVEAQFKKMGIVPGQSVKLKLADGSIIATRWMDRTAKAYNGEILTGRYDIFQKNGAHGKQDIGVVGIST